MKKLIFTLLLLPALCALAQTQRTSLLKINAGEQLMVWESNIGISCSGESICVVSKSDKDEYFVYINGSKQGPYPDAASAMKKCGETGFKEPPAVTTHYEAGMVNPEFEEKGVHYIFNGITYGPFSDMSVNVSPDKKHFMAVGAKDGKFFFMSDMVRDIPVAGRAKYYHWDGQGNGICVVRSGFDESVLATINFDNMTEAEKFAFFEEMQQKIENTVEEIFVITLNGNVSAPFSVSSEANNNPALSLTSPGHWVMRDDKRLIIDGNTIQDFPDNYFDNGQVWLSPDGKKWALKFWDKLLFDDGSAYPYPILVNFCNDNRHELKWVSLENENELILFNHKW